MWYTLIGVIIGIILGHFIFKSRPDPDDEARHRSWEPGDGDDLDEDNEITSCPNCGETYDDADQDFLICHHCGYDANKPTQL